MIINGDSVGDERAARMLMDTAIKIAAYAPAKRGQYVSNAGIYWPLIEQLRAALEAMGIDWKAERQ